MIAAAIGRAVADLIDSVASECQLVILVDDAQWADERSQQLLSTLAAGRQSRRLMILLTGREQALLRRFAQSSARCLGIRLAPLRDSETLELSSRALAEREVEADRELNAWIATTSGGNPFVKCLIGHYQSTGERFVVPNSLSHLLDQQVAALGEDAATALRMCVVLGRHSSYERLSMSLELPHVRLQVAVHELERKYLIVPDDGRVQPSHWLVAEAAERSSSPIALSLMHRRVASLLEVTVDDRDASSQLWDCAEHWILAGNDGRAAQVIRECANRAMRIGRPREAAELLLRAGTMVGERHRSGLLSEGVRLADSANESDAVLRGFQLARQFGAKIDFESVELAELIAAQFEWSEPAHLKDRLVAWLTPDRKPEYRLRAALSALIMADQRGDRDLATTALANLKDLSGELDESNRLIFLECLLIYHSSFGDIDDSRPIALTILALAKSLDSLCAADARRKAGVALWRLGESETALSAFEEAYADAASSGLSRLQMSIAAALATVYADHGDSQRLHRWLAEAERLATASPILRESTIYATMQADIACALGDAKTTRAWLDRAVALIRRSRTKARQVATRLRDSIPAPATPADGH